MIKKMTNYMAFAIIEGFCEGEDASEDEIIQAYQHVHDTGMRSHLRGNLAQNIEILIKKGLLKKNNKKVKK